MINIATIGTSWITRSFIGGLDLLSDMYNLSAVYSRSKERGEEFLKDINKTACIFTDLNEMAKDSEIDAVYIASPNSLHFEQAMLMVENKKHVIVEKPMVISEEQFMKLSEAARNNDVIFMEAIIPMHLPARKIIKENLWKIGRIQSSRFQFCQLSSKYKDYVLGNNPNIFNPRFATGTLMDLGVYCVGFAIGLFGKPKKILSTASLLENAADVAGSTIYDYGDYVVSLNYSKVCDANPVAEICGELGTIRINHPSLLTTVTFTDRLTKEVKNLGVEQKHNFYYEISEMIDQIEKGQLESRSVPLSLSQEIHEVMTEMRRQSNIVFPADK
jgi:predicted dehydrogenase